MRSKIGMIVGALAFVVSGILEILHYFDLLDHLLGEKIAGLASGRNFIVLMVVGLLVFVFAWADHRNELRRNPVSHPPRQSQVANPVTTQTVEIHNYPPQQSAVHKQEQVANQIRRHNVQFLGLSRTKTDLQREVPLSEDGIWTVKASFINKSIPGMKVDDYDYVRARVVFSDSGGREILSLSKPIWLDHELTDAVHFEVNTTACLLTAIFGNDNTWAVPFLTKRPPGSWEDQEQIMVDVRQLPSGMGAFHVEITLVDESNVGLEPFSSVLILGPDGSVGL